MHGLEVREGVGGAYKLEESVAKIRESIKMRIHEREKQGNKSLFYKMFC